MSQHVDAIHDAGAQDVHVGYIVAHALISPSYQSYINLDALLRSTIAAKGDTEALEFIKRDELTRREVGKTQPWRESAIDGKEQVRFACFIHLRINGDSTQKGALKPIPVNSGGEDLTGPEGVHS
ncbi:hypothetical protein FIBSPDRAFT_252198 [Athelia psychrophila]|uniref:Uncharacterized protein n=1 Tax=Athelia psychrophila TaxID=1759441 RepID=A0A165XT89_9AGAM|nr:hypothetical protein FIBSPDRAFT_252198 [Fibularhizoctonia sp. CBS 109695]